MLAEPVDFDIGCIFMHEHFLDDAYPYHRLVFFGGDYDIPRAPRPIDGRKFGRNLSGIRRSVVFDLCRGTTAEKQQKERHKNNFDRVLPVKRRVYPLVSRVTSNISEAPLTKCPF